MVNINASTFLPKQGIFWVIDNTLVYYADTIDPNNFIEFGSINHRDTWKYIKNDYTVNGRSVEYDYFPRGRVIVCPIFNDDNLIVGYDCGVYADACIIDDENIREKIENLFDLYLSSCTVTYYGDFSTDNTHYTCHNCRK